MWKLSPQELQQFIRLLETAYNAADDVRNLLALEGRKLEDIVPAAATLPTIFLSVVLKAQTDGWLPELLDAFKRDKPARADIQGFTLTLPAAAIAAAGDPYEDHVVRSSRVMVNRIELRNHVRTLEQGAIYRFLVVTGEEKTGKTYSRHFITHVYERRRTFELGWINLVDLYRAAQGQPLTPEPVAERIFSYLRIAPALVPSKDDEKYERWSQRACNTIIQSMPSAPPGGSAPVTWLMLDGFNSVPLHDGTIAFIEELSRHVEATLTNLRLILLGWKTALPEDAEGLAIRESTKFLSDDDVTDFFERMHRQRLPGLTEEQLLTRVAESLASVKRSVQAGDRFNVALGEAITREWAR